MTMNKKNEFSLHNTRIETMEYNEEKERNKTKKEKRMKFNVE